MKWRQTLVPALGEHFVAWYIVLNDLATVTCISCEEDVKLYSVEHGDSIVMTVDHRIADGINFIHSQNARITELQSLLPPRL